MKMSATLSLLLSLSIVINIASASDITQILNKYPEFSSFNSYLTQTKLAGQINARQTVTVLAVDNGAISSLSSQKPDTIKNILSVHVILDYYDPAKLKQLSTNSPLLTTLFQSSGQSKGQQGFLKVTHPSPDSTAFSSAMPGPTQSSSLIKSVASEPYNISVLQISNAIIPQGIDGTKTSSPQSVTHTSATSPVAAATTGKAPAPSVAPPTTAASTPTSTPPTKAAAGAPAATTASPPTKAATPTSSTSSPPTTAATATPSTAPTAADTPSAAAAPEGGAPTPSEASAPGAPASEGEPAEATPAADEPQKKNAGAAMEIGLGVVWAMALSTLYLTSSV